MRRPILPTITSLGKVGALWAMAHGQLVPLELLSMISAPFRAATMWSTTSTVPKIADKKIYNNILGQALAIRAFDYARMNFWYGGVPIMDDFFPNAEAAKVPRNTEAEVWAHFDKDIDRAISLLPNAPAESGRIAKGYCLSHQDALCTLSW